jgi:hypothetical protein
MRKLVAALILLRALTNFGKPFQPDSGFVILGRLLHGAPWTTVVAPAFGLAMCVYAGGLWRARRWAIPAGIAYAVWATFNVVSFPIVEGIPARFAPWMYVLFAVPGVVVPWYAVRLARRDAEPAARR